MTHYVCGFCGSSLHVDGEILHAEGCASLSRLIVHVDGNGDQVCQHGTAMDVHCCNCHSGFIFDLEHECDPPND